MVTTLAGSTNSGYADGTGGAALFYWPTALAVDGSGNVYVADYYNGVIRMVTSNGVVTTVAGKQSVFGYQDGPASTALFYMVQGVTVNRAGTLLYVADRYCIRKISLEPGPVRLVAPAQTGLTGSTPQTISGTPTCLIPATTYYYHAVAGNGAATAIGDTLSFTTTDAGGSVTLADAAIMLASSLNPSVYGASVTFTSTVVPSQASGIVTFSDGGAPLGTATLSGGMATFTTNGLALGTHNITARYSGDCDYNASTNAFVCIQAVDKAAPLVTTWPAAASITYGQILAASGLSGGSGTPVGGFSWTTPTTAPNAGTAPQSVTFTPSDSSNYNPSNWTVSVTVNKATPTVNTWPAASAITVGQALSASTLSGGGATVAGGFTFDAPATTPPRGTYPAAVTFTPTDAVNYAAVRATVSVNSSGAVTCTPLQSGSWDDPATWGGTLPAAGDDIVIPAGIAVTLGSNAPAFKNLTITGTLNLGPNTLQVSGNFTNTGTFNPGTGTVQLTGGAEQILAATAPGTLAFYNLTVNKTPAAATVTAA
ncbi:MAG: Ig-like domain repeat protein, partial [Verrucomicrobiota bacterium]